MFEVANNKLVNIRIIIKNNNMDLIVEELDDNSAASRLNDSR